MDDLIKIIKLAEALGYDVSLMTVDEAVNLKVKIFKIMEDNIPTAKG